jgi:mRNA-degrading endonuclease RelE of RelBE toxin-antitoxin system
MEFRIADTFTDSLRRLTGDEQKAVKTTAFDLQLNPANPGMSFHKLTRARDKNFWSVRVNADVRIIVHRTQASLLLCYVDHHEQAYRWAEVRKLETHPKTGAAQLVELRQVVQDVDGSGWKEPSAVTPASPLLFARITDEDLLGYGVPMEWLGAVRQATEDTLLDLADHLPAEAAEALLALATGVQPKMAAATEIGRYAPFDHPDAQRRFRVVANVEELERALDYPWEKWTVFLHPAQRQTVERDFSGPARVSGSAGTGKTIVALHRAVNLARKNPDARVLLATFSELLANALRNKLKVLAGNEPRLGERIDVHAMDALGERLNRLWLGRLRVADTETVSVLLKGAASTSTGIRQGEQFMLSEWDEVVDAWQLKTWEEYRDVPRLGRKTRLPEKMRKALWDVFSAVSAGLAEQNQVTRAGLFTRLAELVASLKAPPFDYVVIDEAQDVSVPQLRFLAALGAGRANGLFFAGDLGQRIFQLPFSWKSLGVEVRGRCQTLRVNYRTSHQIREQADRLLGPTVADVDGNTDDRRGTTSVFNGPEPTILVAPSPDEEIAAVARWLTARIGEGLSASELGVFVRSEKELGRAAGAMQLAGIPFRVLDTRLDTAPGEAAVCTMHLAKGLEFRAVAVMACDDEVVPLQERIESVADNADLEEVYETERHLLYVACTRARDNLMVSCVAPGSEFLDDLKRQE